MSGKWFAAGLLAAGVMAFAPSAHAGDTHKLSIPHGAADVPLVKLVDDGKGADVVDVRYGGYRGGYRGGYYGGYRGGYRGGYYGYRGYYGGYRGFYGGYYGYYPRYRNYGYYGYYGPSLGYYSSYYAPSVYYSAPSYYSDHCLYPSAGVSAPTLSLSITRATTVQPEVLLTMPTIVAPAPQAVPIQPDDATFPYDGGPRAPLPMPKADAPAVPLPAAPASDKSVSLPAKVAGKLVYPAYGERPALDRTPVDAPSVLVKGDPDRKLTK